jgi:hypothetical protein
MSGLCQAKDVLPFIAPKVGDAGVCITTADGMEQAIESLDLALDALMKRIDSHGTLWYWVVPTYTGCFSLPEDCLEARQMFVNGVSAMQRDQWYQGRLAYGIKDCGTACQMEVRDLGEYALPIPLPNKFPIRMAFTAAFDSDAGTHVVCEVIDQYGKRVKETLTMLPNQEAVTMESPAMDVTYIGKPQTDGPIKVFLSYDNGQRFYVCDAGPKVQSTAFRRKKLPQRFWGCNEVRIFGKRRYYRVTSENDIIPICDRLALGKAVTAIADDRKRDEQGYQTNLTAALNELWKGMENADSAGNVSPVQFVSGFRTNPSLARGYKAFL